LTSVFSSVLAFSPSSMQFSRFSLDSFESSSLFSPWEN
jgi:hypothetical protein